MCTFVPKGNQPLTTPPQTETNESPPKSQEERTLNPFPAWRWPDDDEFLVDL